MSEPGILYGGRGGRGGYGPYARFGQLILHVDARSQTGGENAGMGELTDLSPSRTNALRTVSGTPRGRSGVIGGYCAIELGTADTGLAKIFQASLPNPFTGPLTWLLVVLPLPTGNAEAYFLSYLTDTGNVAIGKVQSSGALKIRAGSGPLTSAGPVFTDGSPALVIAVVNGASSIVRANGLEVLTGDLGSSKITECRFGSDTGGASPMSGHLGAAACFRGAMRPDTAVALERFVDRDWNLRLGL
jgi:hypothetical protein